MGTEGIGLLSRLSKLLKALIAFWSRHTLVRILPPRPDFTGRSFIHFEALPCDEGRPPMAVWRSWPTGLILWLAALGPSTTR